MYSNTNVKSKFESHIKSSEVKLYSPNRRKDDSWIQSIRTTNTHSHCKRLTHGKRTNIVEIFSFFWVENSNTPKSEKEKRTIQKSKPTNRREIDQKINRIASKNWPFPMISTIKVWEKEKKGKIAVPNDSNTSIIIAEREIQTHI